VALGKRPHEAEEPHGDGDQVDIYQIPPKKQARSGGVSNGILKAAWSTARTHHKPVAKRTPNTPTNNKPKAAGHGAERLASPNAQGIYCQSLLGPLQQGWMEEAVNGMPISVEGRVDEKVVHCNNSTMKQQQQQQQEKEEPFHTPTKFKPMQKALLKATKMASGVEEIKCCLCPETHLKTLQEFKRHCNTAEAHPLEISFCDYCGDFFARRDSLQRHQKNPPPECKRATKEAKKKRRETQLAHDDFLRGLEECLKTGNMKDFVPFSQIIKDKYPKSAKKRIGSRKIVESVQGTM
jgi:hypothetical protein